MLKSPAKGELSSAYGELSSAYELKVSSAQAYELKVSSAHLIVSSAQLSSCFAHGGKPNPNPCPKSLPPTLIKVWNGLKI